MSLSPLGDTRGLAAIGVVLFDGEGRRRFTEGVLRSGVEVTPHVYLTLDLSLTVAQRDYDVGQARVVAVPRSGGPGATLLVPSLELDDGFVLSAAVGFALDLAAFAAAADDVVNALGGS